MASMVAAHVFQLRNHVVAEGAFWQRSITAHIPCSACTQNCRCRTRWALRTFCQV